MKERHKNFLKLNFLSIVLTAISFISVTLAWFAYSGLSTVETDVNIRAWNIELSKDGKKVQNQITISLNDLYPGMETVHESVKINNLGDSDAIVKYEIKSARILGDKENLYDTKNGKTTKEIEDILSNEFPFQINLNLSKNFALPDGEETIFDLSVSWPLDSGDDEEDTKWGIKAHEFLESEIQKSEQDSSYQKDPSIFVQISLIAEQYLENDDAPDVNYYLGKEYLIDVIDNKTCNKISDTCFKTTVIDADNTLKDDTVNLIPNLYSEYEEGTFDTYSNSINQIQNNWSVNVSPLDLQSLLKVISKDITESYTSYTNLSSSIIGNINSVNSLNKTVNKVKNFTGNFNYLSENYPYLVSSRCIWLNDEYDSEHGFIFKEENDRVYIKKEHKNTTCKIIPIIKMNKEDLENN